MVALRVYGAIEPLNVAMPLLKVFSFAAGVAATSYIPTSDSAGLFFPNNPPQSNFNSKTNPIQTSVF